MRNNLTKIFAVMAMSVMTLTAGAINIPQAAVGDYILIGDGSTNPKTTATGVTLTKCQVDGSSATSYTVGSTGAQTQIEFALNATEAGYYSFSFMSGSNGYTAKLSLSLKNSSSEEVWSGTTDIINNSTWNLTSRHLFALGNLSVDTYTMTIKVTEQTTVSGDHSYAGNYGNFCFHTATQYNYYQSIPQDLGSYIVLGSATGADGFANYITKANCNVDTRLGDAENSKYYTIGTTHANTKLNINVSVAEAGNYVFGFKSGASGCSSVVNVKMIAFGSDTPMFTSSDIAIANDGNWDPNKAHNFYIPNVAAGYYTISLEVKENTGSYAGNFGNFYFHHVNQLGWATSSAYMELSDGTFTNAKDNYDNVISNIGRTGGSIDDLLVYNGEADYRVFHFGIEYIKQTSKVTITVKDFVTGVQEAQALKVVTANGDFLQPLTTEISAGLKVIRFDFADNDETEDDSYLFNFKQVYFTSPADYEALPLTGEATLDLNQTGVNFNNCQYKDDANNPQNICFVKNGGYADNYFIYNSIPTAHFTLDAGIPWYKKGGTFKITITDVATGEVEVNAQESPAITGTGDVHFDITNAITHGLKKIRFDFVKAGESDYLFNLNNVSFTAIKYTREHPHMNLNTLCFPYQIDYCTGATFYTILETEVEAGELTKLVLEEHVGALEAGVPYFYDPTEGAEELVCYYSGEEQATPLTAANGAFVGKYINDGVAIPVGSYVTVNNQLYKCGEGVKLADYRAYVTPTTYTRAAVPGRRKLTIGGKNSPTNVENVQSDKVQSTKVLRNGQLYIMYEGTMYNVQGQVVNR